MILNWFMTAQEQPKTFIVQKLKVQLIAIEKTEGQ